MNKKLFAQLIIVFVVAEVLGLLVANSLIQQSVTAAIVNDNPEDMVNIAALFAYILVFTGILLLLIKFLKDKFLYYLLKGLELLAIFGTAVIVFGVFIDGWYALAISIILVALRIVFSKNLLLRNVTTIIAVAGAGALIGVSLGILPVLAFISVLAIYDYISVFRTKHMVKMAKAIADKNLSFTYAMPTPEHKFELGTGDLVMPLMFATAALKYYSAILCYPYNLIPPAAILLASLWGLLWTMNIVSRKVGTALPALPPQTACMLIVFVALKIAGF